MRKVLILAKREYKSAVKTKGFIIGLMLAPLLMGGSFIMMAIFQDRVDTTDRTIVVVDRSGLVADALVEAANARNAAELYDNDTKKKVKPAYFVEVVPPATDQSRQRLELSNRVRADEIHAFIEIGSGVLNPKERPEDSYISYYSKNSVMDEARGWVVFPINDHLRQIRAHNAGIDQASVEGLLGWVNVDGMGLVSVDTQTGEIKEARRSSEAEAIGVPFAMIMLMFMMIMMGAIPQLHAVMEEKSQRIAEVLLGSVRPFDLMAGKIVGGVAVALTAATVYVVLAVVVFGRMEMADRIPYHILPWFFGYVVLAIVMFGSMMAAVGSACNDSKEAQSVTPMIMFPVLIPMFLIVPVATQPRSVFATWLSLFPPFSPMLMLLRQSTPVGVPSWQPWVAVAGMLVFAVLFVWAGGRVFRVGILMQGKPPRLGEIMRWAIRG